MSTPHNSTDWCLSGIKCGCLVKIMLFSESIFATSAQISRHTLKLFVEEFSTNKNSVSGISGIPFTWPVETDTGSSNWEWKITPRNPPKAFKHATLPPIIKVRKMEIPRKQMAFHLRKKLWSSHIAQHFQAHDFSKEEISSRLCTEISFPKEYWGFFVQTWIRAPVGKPCFAAIKEVKYLLHSNLVTRTVLITRAVRKPLKGLFLKNQFPTHVASERKKMTSWNLCESKKAW